ncbi:MAG: hypothetical protein R3C58_06800 [Parvularculaceae bacterium]
MDEVAASPLLKGAEINEAKVLANEATRLLHNDKAAKAPPQRAENEQEGGLGGDLPTVDLSAEDVDSAASS